MKDKPFFKRLNGSFAIRYSDYSTSGSEKTIKGGLDWKPVEDVLLRGNYSEGYRPPSIGELFGSPSRFDQVIDDPCWSTSGASANINNNATVAASCAAQGVPAGYTQAGAQVGVVTGGNRDLKAETSRSWVGGVVYNASWARGFARTLTLEASYFNVKVKGAIQSVDANTLIGLCLQNGDQSACSAIPRAGTGDITQIFGLLQNIGGIRTDGLDVNLTYRTPETGFGSFGLTWANTFLFHYTEIDPATDGVVRIKHEGTENGSPDQAYPRYESTAIASWTLGDFTASITGRYISGVTEIQNSDSHLKRRLYGDIQLLWDTKMGSTPFRFAVGVNNLSGIAPPPCTTCSLNNSDPTTYDIPGQYCYARIGVKI